MKTVLAWALVLVLITACAPGPRLTAELTSSTGRKGWVYLYAPDEQVQVVDEPSCMAERGDTIRTGAYRFYLQPEGADNPMLQQVSPYPGESLSFHDQREYLQVLPGKAGTYPDLLAVIQYGSCNGNAVAFLALAPDGKHLVHYRLKFPDGSLRLTAGTRSIEMLRPGALRTSQYNNATGKLVTFTWEVRESEGLLVAVEHGTVVLESR